MRFGLERMRRLLTALGSPQERFRRDPRRRHERQELDGPHDRGAARGARRPHGRVPLAAPDLVRRAHPRRRPRPRARRVRRRRRARGGGGGEGRPRAGGGRPRHAVRAHHRRRVRRAGAPGASTSRWSRRGSAAATTPTGVLRAPVVVLTNVGLEHTRWLGPTIGDIAREKLAVVAPGAMLVLGEADAEVAALAEATGAGSCGRTRGRDRPARVTSGRTSRWPAPPPASTSAPARPGRGRARGRADHGARAPAGRRRARR